MERRQPRMQDEHAAGVSRLFSGIVNWYDFLNRLLSFGLDQGWRRCLADSVFPGLDGSASGKTVLDLAAGTLDVSLALRRRYPGARVLAMDFCFPMLARGRRKLGADEGAAILSTAADARILPLPDSSVDGITMAFGIRNIAPRSEAFAEMARVLTQGGRACVLEFGTGRNRIWLGAYNVYLRRVLPVMGRLSGDPDAYRYLARTIMEFPDADALSEEMRAAGFARVYHIPLCSGVVRLHVAEKA